MAQDNKKRLSEALSSLKQVVDSPITPRNIKKIVKDTMNLLHNERVSIGVRAASSISMLEEVSQDPNMPSFSRVTIWAAVSSLESIREY